MSKSLRSLKETLATFEREAALLLEASGLEPVAVQAIVKAGSSLAWKRLASLAGAVGPGGAPEEAVVAADRSAEVAIGGLEASSDALEDSLQNLGAALRRGRELSGKLSRQIDRLPASEARASQRH